MTVPTLAQFRAEYVKADALCQEIQGFSNKAGIPAMNELRNAGHHLLRAIDDTWALENQSEITNAMGHARRACYEATEAGIVFAVSMVKKFRDDYSTIKLSDLVPNYIERTKRCNEALRLIEIGRQDDFDRAADHQNRIDIFRELRIFCDDIDIAREEANKTLAQNQIATRRFITQVSLTIFGIAVAVALSIWAWLRPVITAQTL